MTDNSKDIDSKETEEQSSDLTDVKVPESSNEAEQGLPKDKPKAKRKRKLSGAMVALILTVIVILAVAASGFWVWLSVQSQLQALVNEQATLGEQLDSANQQISQLSNARQQAQQSWQNEVKHLENLVVQSAQRLNRESNRTEARWPLEEALTLARLAQQRLQLDAHAGVAVGLLQSADQVLAGLDQAAVLPLRRQLSSDVLALQTTAAVDINGRYFDLEAIAEQIKGLSWMPKPTLKEELADDADLSTGFWHSLKQVVVVTRLDTPLAAPPILTDFERWRQYQLLLIEQIQLALLARNQPLFDAALSQAAEQLAVMDSQFDFTVIKARFASLATAQLNPKWPDIGQSVLKIEQYIAEQDADQSELQTEEGSE